MTSARRGRSGNGTSCCAKRITGREKKGEKKRLCNDDNSRSSAPGDTAVPGRETHGRRKSTRIAAAAAALDDISNANGIYHFLAGSLESIVADELLMRGAVSIGVTCRVFCFGRLAITSALLRLARRKTRVNPTSPRV